MTGGGVSVGRRQKAATLADNNGNGNGNGNGHSGNTYAGRNGGSNGGSGGGSNGGNGAGRRGGRMGGRMGGRIGTSHSKIHKDTSPIYALANQWQGLGIHMPDPMPLIVTMGAFAANCMTGDPVWLWLVGASGSGKTMVLKSLRSLPRTRMVSSISGEAALLSGVKKKDRAKDATGGLLTELGVDGGCLLFMDLTTELSKRKEEVTQFFGALREIYDKTYSRSIGGEGGRTIRFEGRVAIIGGVTSAVDRMAGISQEMGQRTIFYRMPLSSGYQESMAAVRNTLPDETQELMGMQVEMMFHLLGLGLGKEELRERPQLPLHTADWIVRMGQAAAKMRAGVPRDFTNREVTDMVEPEMATRLSRQMASLYCGMAAIGADEADRKVALEKIAMDCMPRLRLAVIEELEGGNGDSAKIAERLKVSETTARRTLEDLMAVGVADKGKGRGMAAVSAAAVSAAAATTAGAVGKPGKTQANRPSWGLTEWADGYLGEIRAGRMAVKEAADAL